MEGHTRQGEKRLMQHVIKIENRLKIFEVSIVVLSINFKPPFTSMMKNWEGGFVLDSFLVGWMR